MPRITCGYQFVYNRRARQWDSALGTVWRTVVIRGRFMACVGPLWAPTSKILCNPKTGMGIRFKSFKAAARALIKAATVK